MANPLHPFAQGDTGNQTTDTPPSTGNAQVDAELADMMEKGWVTWSGTHFHVTDEGRRALAEDEARRG